MPYQPILSIITPTRGNFSEYWLQQLLTINGDVQFILVYPPDVNLSPIDDPRVKVMHSPYKGETIQRTVGILNADGKYLLALDDDDFLHPDVLKLVIEYFEQFPESWVLRLYKIDVDYLADTKIRSDWASIPDISQLKVVKRKASNPEELVLREFPIAPLENKFNVFLALWPYAKRRDHHGAHIENFNNKVWKTELVKKALADLSQSMRIGDPITWLPSWGFDRLLGLFVQAKFYQKDICIGHWLPAPEQMRYIKKPSSLKEIRSMFPSDALLAKSFPQYGYFWNLFFEELYNGIKTNIKKRLMRQE